MNLKSIQLLILLIITFNVSGQHFKDSSFLKILELKNKLCSTNLVIYPGHGILNYRDSNGNTGVQLIKLLDNNGIIQLQYSKCAPLKIYSYMALLAKKLPIADTFRYKLNRDTSEVNFLDGCIMIATSIKQLVSTIDMLQSREDLKNNITGMPEGFINYKLEEGIHFEMLDSQNTDQNKFTKNNKLYLANKEFTYLAAGYINATAEGQAITDTLQWLKTNIEQKSSNYTGKPIGILLDTLAHRCIYKGICQYIAPITSDGAAAETKAGDTVYTSKFKIYFGNVLYRHGTVSQLHRENPSINTHLKWIYIKFTNQIPFPSRILSDRYLGNQFGPVEGICRPYIVKSVTVGEF